MENTENNKKIQIEIYENQIQKFIEPEWMKVLKDIIKNAKDENIIGTLPKSF